MIERLECQGLLRLVRDDTSSLLWLRDSQSIGTYRSTGPQDFGTINTTFDFDTEVFASKVYRTATRSSMLRTLLLDARPDGQQGFIDPTSGPSTRQVESGLHVANEPTADQLSVSRAPTPEEQTPNENRDNTPDTELQRLPSPTALPKYTIYTLETLQRLPTAPVPLKTSSLPNESQQRVRRRRPLLTRPWLARPSNPTHSAIIDSQMAKPTVKVLMMGISESGKSTLIKSLKAGYMGGYDEESRRQYRKVTLRNLLETAKSIVMAVGMEEEVARSISQQIREDNRACVAACDLLKGLTMNDDFDQSGAVSKTSEFSLRTDVASAIQTLWSQTQSHQVLDKSILQSSFYVMDNANQ